MGVDSVPRGPALKKADRNQRTVHIWFCCGEWTGRNQLRDRKRLCSLPGSRQQPGGPQVCRQVCMCLLLPASSPGDQPAGGSVRATGTEHLLWATSCEPLPRSRGGGWSFVCCMCIRLSALENNSSRSASSTSLALRVSGMRPLSSRGPFCLAALSRSPAPGDPEHPCVFQWVEGSAGVVGTGSLVPQPVCAPGGGSVLKITSDTPGGCKG